MTGVGAVAPAEGVPAESPLPGAPAEGFGAELLAAVRTQARSRYVTLGQMATGSLHPSLALPAMAAAVLAPPAATPVAVPATVAAPAAAPAASPSSGGMPEKIVQAAKRYLGVPYRWGGTNPATGLDCSGFTQRVFRDLGVSIPRVSIDQSRAGTPVASLAEARPGDLVFRRGSPNHIGIYLGDGKFIHAPRTGDVVKVAPLTWTPTAIRRVR